MKKINPKKEIPPKKNTLQKYLWCLPLIAILSAGIFLRLHNLDFDTQSSLNRSPDEPIYTAYASVIAHEGLKNGTQISIGEYNKNEKLQGYPPPTRIGYLYPLALVMRMTGRFDTDLGIYVSCAVSILALFVLAAIVIRFFNPIIAISSCLLMAFSPMELMLARKVWQDNLMTLVSGILLYLCLEITLGPPNWILLSLFAVLGGYSLLIKESGVVIYGLCAIWILAVMLKERRFKSAVISLLIFLASVGVSLFFLVSISGGLSDLLQLFRNFSESWSHNHYVVQYQSGPWYALWKGFFLVNPFVLFFCLAGSVTILFFERRSAGLCIVFLFFLFLGVASIPKYFKDLRFVSPIYMLYYLLGATAVGAGFSWAQKKLKGLWQLTAIALLIIGMSTAFWIDLANFDKIFIQNHAKDLTNDLLNEYSFFGSRSQQ